MLPAIFLILVFCVTLVRYFQHLLDRKVGDRDFHYADPISSIESSEAKVLYMMWNGGGQCYCKIRTVTGIEDQQLRQTLRSLLKKQLVYELDNSRIAPRFSASSALKAFKSALFEPAITTRHTKSNSSSTFVPAAANSHTDSIDGNLRLYAINRKKMRAILRAQK